MRKLPCSIFPFSIILASTLTFSGCHSDARASDANAAETPSATVVSVARGSIVRKLNLAGQFQPYQVIDVHAKVSGYIRHIYVDIGDKVHQGQVLAVLEVPELDAQLRGTGAEFARSKDEITRAEHEISRAQSEHSALHNDYKRLKQASASQPGLIAEQELDDAQSKDLASEARVDAAKSALAAAKQQSEGAKADNERVGDLADYTRVTAPLDGVIIWRYADTGALIQAGTASDTQSLPIVKLSQSGLLRLRLPVPEDAVEFIHEGATVTVNVDAIHRSFEGKVVRFTRNLSLATRTMETEIDVANKDLSLNTGRICQHNHRTRTPRQCPDDSGASSNSQRWPGVGSCRRCVASRSDTKHYDRSTRLEPYRSEVRPCRGRPRHHRESIKLSAGRNRGDQPPAEYRLGYQ